MGKDEVIPLIEGEIEIGTSPDEGVLEKLLDNAMDGAVLGSASDNDVDVETTRVLDIIGIVLLEDLLDRGRELADVESVLDTRVGSAVLGDVLDIDFELAESKSVLDTGVGFCRLEDVLGIEMRLKDVEDTVGVDVEFEDMLNVDAELTKVDPMLKLEVELGRVDDALDEDVKLASVEYVLEVGLALKGDVEIVGADEVLAKVEISDLEGKLVDA